MILTNSKFSEGSDVTYVNP